MSGFAQPNTESWRGRRPRGMFVGRPVDVPHLRDVGVGTKIVVRDALGATHDRIAASPAVWGHDFAVVWVHRDGAKDLTPWPCEDVWLRSAAPPEGADDGSGR